MRVVVFSTDRNILKPDSAAYMRQQAYAKHFDSYTVFVGSLLPRAMTICNIAPNATAYPLHPLSFFGSLGLVYRELKRADIFSSQDPFEAGLFGLFASWFSRKPLHVQVHTNFYAIAFAHSSFRNWMLCTFAPVVARRANRIRVVSESIKESIQKNIAPKAPITVLPIFVDTKRFQNIPRIKHQQFKIALLVVSRLEKEKNVRLAISALKVARERGHDAGLTVVGAGSEEGRLNAQARSFGLERFVAFVGEGDPVPHYTSADVLLVPSLYEGYGMVIIEALSAGIPVIATDVGIAREAGAIVTSEKDFEKTVSRWIESGPRQSSLTGYPYTSFEQYVQLYCSDLKATTS